MGALEELSKEYEPTEFQIIGICDDLYDKGGNLKPDQVEKAKQIMSDAGVEFPTLIPNEGFRDFLRSSVVAFPTTFFVDSEGNVVDTVTGGKDLKGWEDCVNDELAKLK